MTPIKHTHQLKADSDKAMEFVKAPMPFPQSLDEFIDERRAIMGEERWLQLNEEWSELKAEGE